MDNLFGFSFSLKCVILVSLNAPKCILLVYAVYNLLVYAVYIYFSLVG